MDPSNNTPAEPNAVAPETPATEPATSPEAPAAPAAEPAPVTTEPTPVASETPAAPATPTAPVNADVANAALNPPVNPVVTPSTSQVSGAPVANAAAGGTMSMNQMFQTQPATKADVFAETTAIAVPEGPKAPDPVEEELKAPLKAADPVPGSIGSAVSVPSEGGATPNGAPAADSAVNPMTATPVAPASASAAPANPADSANPAAPANGMAANPAAPNAKKPSIFDKLTAKSKMNKKTLIILCAVAGVVLVALIIVLILVATGAI